MSDEKKITLHCNRIVPGVPNMNGNIYPRAVLEQMVQQVQDKIKDRRFFGRLGSSPEPIRINDASHLVTSLSLDEAGKLVTELEVLNTVKGQALRDLLDKLGEDNLESIPYGIGSTTPLSGGRRRVGDDYRLISMDVVPALGAEAPASTRREATIRVPVLVDEQGNCRVVGWSTGGHGADENDFLDMEEEARDLHHTSFQHLNPKTVVTRWATIKVPLPESATEIATVFQAEGNDDEADG